jgi:NAD(P)-dependent dehydrogenase (short-subunit alcohol dehydrogenase family)
MKFSSPAGALLSVLALILLVPVSAPAADQKAVLVTGANSGIGRNIAERLAREGYFVYAGARRDADIEELSAIENMQGIRLDVTIQEDIDAAVETVRAEDRGLYGVVNNAGVVIMSILAETPEAEMDFVFDVNVYGPYRVVNAFAPLLIESRGRITTISSMAGLSSPPGYGVYSMSKHAIEAFSDTLAAEMGTAGIRSSVVEPGPYKSNAVASNCKRRAMQNYDPSESLFPEMAKELAALCQGDLKNDFPEPDAVADAVLHALFAENPKARYLAVTDRRHAEFIMRSAIAELAELSDGLRFEFSRDELIAILDEALASATSDR